LRTITTTVERKGGHRKSRNKTKNKASPYHIRKTVFSRYQLANDQVCHINGATTANGYWNAKLQAATWNKNVQVSSKGVAAWLKRW
jgi:hypothetical protein